MDVSSSRCVQGHPGEGVGGEREALSQPPLCLRAEHEGLMQPCLGPQETGQATLMTGQGPGQLPAPASCTAQGAKNGRPTGTQRLG